MLNNERLFAYNICREVIIMDNLRSPIDKSDEKLKEQKNLRCQDFFCSVRCPNSTFYFRVVAGVFSFHP